MTHLTEHHAPSQKLLGGDNPVFHHLPIRSVYGANVQTVIQEVQPYSNLIYAEGDSWFGKWTPLGGKWFPIGQKKRTNLLESLRLPIENCAIVDSSFIGDTAQDMVRGWQARNNIEFLENEAIGFKAILLSAGGNDLKNAFGEIFLERALMQRGVNLTPNFLGGNALLGDKDRRDAFFFEVIANIKRFISFRDLARNKTTRNAPIFLHGYDYFQPRPAGAKVKYIIGTGPWLYKEMKDAGLDAKQMLAQVKDAVDEFNDRLATAFINTAGVNFIDQRGLLTLAKPETSKSDGDWIDEIHLNQQGLDKLTLNCWDVPLAKALGWSPKAGDIAT